MKKETLIVALALGTLFAAAAAARPGHRGPWGGSSQLWEGLVADFDADGDGRITLEEFGRAEATFQNLDRDGDATLSQADFERGHEMRGRRMHERGLHRGAMAGGFLALRADADENREVTSTEWQEFVTELDADGNGEITPEEWRATLPAPPDREPPPERLEMFGHMFDQDGDGTVETSDLDALFDTLDADTSGAIEEGELPKRRWRHRGRG